MSNNRHSLSKQLALINKDISCAKQGHMNMLGVSISAIAVQTLHKYSSGASVYIVATVSSIISAFRQIKI